MISLLAMVALMRSYPERMLVASSLSRFIWGYGGTAADPKRDVVAGHRSQL